MDDTLRRLSQHAGIELGFRNAYGAYVESSSNSIEATLTALGYDISSDTKRNIALESIERSVLPLIPGTILVSAGDRPVLHPNMQGGEVTWRLTCEDGTRSEGRSSLTGEGGRPGFSLDVLPIGYHRVEIEAEGRTAVTALLVSPQTCFLPRALEHERRGFGITAQIYGLCSAGNFGVGDFSDVRDLGEGAGRFGAAFLGLSPVHCLFPSDRSKYSPYSPSSRLFIDPIFINPTQLPDFPSSGASRYLNSPDVGAELNRLRHTHLVDYASSWAIKRSVLDRYWMRFANSDDPDFAQFRRDSGEPLELHATFEALSEHFVADQKMWVGDWPTAFQDASGSAVREFRKTHPEKIAFHAWLQWLADSQLAKAQSHAINSGMSIGLYRDLAVGADRAGSEYWTRPDWFVPGVAIGAPPDLLGPTGQNWGLPPINPKTLQAQGLQAFRTLVAANMRHAGAIRIDHAFQLQRLYIIPDGLTAVDGVYLNYPFEAMLAVLRIESHRARALVIAEDLGTAPEGFSDAIMRSDILSYRILNFEREYDGVFKSPSAFPQKALAAVGTHDLPPFASWWKGFDTDLRQTFEIYTQDQADKERRERGGELLKFSQALAREHVVPLDTVPIDPPIEEAFRYIAKTRSMLVALQLEDILGEADQANLPGPDRGHPNWRRKLKGTVDTLIAPGGLLARSCSAMIEEGRGLRLDAPRLTWPPPTATYRLQFHKSFTFADAEKILPHLRSLGVSHVYASPILKARPGSTHGYDTVDPQEINPELGGLNGFEALAAKIKAHDMELLLDIVPNHMGVGGSDNPWWLSVLEWGEESPYADTFDIDWERFGSNGKMVVPFLAHQYGETLEKGELKLVFDKAEGSFSVWHFDHRFPICPLTYPQIMDRALAADISDGSEGIDGMFRIEEDLRALAVELPHRRQNIVNACERLKRRLSILARRSAVAAAIDQAVSIVNGTPGLPESFGSLHRLLERQSYRLSFWRVAASDINYRRFFDIDGLAGVRIEEPAVFERTHSLIFQLIRRGLVQGLRIDHIDGLADPKAYAAALQQTIGPNFYVVAEKILETNESLRPWPLAGTTGYEMLNLIDGILVDESSARSFDRMYREMTGFADGYDEALLTAKQQVILEGFSSELESLVSDVKRIADSNRLTRDYSVNAIRVALADLICAFPVYRTYITSRGVEDEDRTLLADVIAKAKSISALPDRSIHDFVGSILLGTIAMGRPGRAAPPLINRFRRRFQQLTGPVMAKSLEDTLFYRYGRFLALNEVGGEPDRFGIPIADFHKLNRERAQTWPQALTTTATHDTKRGEDARARLIGLSEVPDLWAQALAVWRAEIGLLEAPDANDQYLLLQSLLGAWPLELLESDDEATLKALRKRFSTFIPKAFREAKRHSKWIEPNLPYENATIDLMDRLLVPGSRFIEGLRPIVQDLAQRGMCNSLVRTVLKCTLPGVPDFYQGTALWDFSLVDPDNRRSIDYVEHQELSRTEESLTSLLAHWKDVKVKLRLTTCLLSDRRDHALFYAKADYTPLTVTGEKWAKVVALSRRHRDEILIVLVARTAGSGFAKAAMPTGQSYWGSTVVDLPIGTFRDIFSELEIESKGSFNVADLLQTLPFAVLRKRA